MVKMVYRTIGIIGGSIGAYLLAFVYERGFAKYFAIPQDFVTLNLMDFFIAVSEMWIFIGSYLFLVSIFLLLHKFLNKYKRTRLCIKRLIILISPYIVLFLALPRFYFYNFLHHYEGWTLSRLYETLFEKSDVGYGGIVIQILFIFILFLVILFLYEYISRVPQGKPLLRGNKWRVLDMDLLTIIVILIHLLVISYYNGRAVAIAKEKFLVPTKLIADSSEVMDNNSPYYLSKPTVVLRKYGNKLICAPFDSVNKTVERNFIVLKMAEDTALILRCEILGPLHPEEE